MSLDNSALAVGSSTVHLHSRSADGAPTAAGLTFTPLDASNIEVAGTTLLVNGPKGTISGMVISLASAGLILGTKTFAMPLPMPDPDKTPTANGIFTLADQIDASKSKSGVAVAGTTLSVNRPDTTRSGTSIPGAPAGQVVAGQTLTVPTPSPGPTGEAVIIAGNTVTAGGSPVTIAGIPLSLAIGPSGLYVSAQGSGSVTLTASVLAGASMSLDPAGQLVVGGSTLTQATGDGNGGLGSAIMAGFGPASSAAGTDHDILHATTGPGAGGGLASTGTDRGNGNATASVLGFAGGARRLAGMGVMRMVGLVSIVGWVGFLSP